MKSLSDRLDNVEIINRGNLATCYRAREIALDRLVFLKIVHSELSSDPDTQARFVREARAVARLDHPNLVRLYEFGEDPEKGLYIILEWVEGQTVADILRTKKYLNPDEVGELARQILGGLGALHSAGVVHRDIKPNNILIRNDGTCKISDFSLAALRDEPRLTHHAAIVGTPAYMSPEQAAGGSPDARSDLFAVGVVLYECTTGQNPFAAEDLLEAMRRVRQVRPSFDNDKFGALTARVRNMIVSCLEKDPNARPKSASVALELLGAEEDLTSKRRAMQRRASWILVASGVALILAVVLFTNDVFHKPNTQNANGLPDSFSSAAGFGSGSVDSTDEFGLKSVTPSDSHPFATEPMKSLVHNNRHEAREGAVNTNTVAIYDDSAEVFIDVQPWAHVYFGGMRIGTTPMREFVRLPIGEHTLTFRNSAFPRIDVSVNIRPGNDTLRVDLAQYVTTLMLAVTPWGNVYLDGEKTGTTPLEQPMFFLPGLHDIRIVHPEFAPVERTFNAAAGDTLFMTVDFDNSQVAMRQSRHSSN